MKKLFLLIFVATFVLFTSCEKDAEPEPITLAQNLENGIWENDNYNFWKFDGMNITDYYSVGWNTFTHSRCVHHEYKSVTPYTLGDNTISLPDRGELNLPIKIEGDVLTLDNTYKFQRKEGFPSCN